MVEEKAVGVRDGKRYIDYEVLYRNFLNEDWSEWPEIYEIVRNIEESGSSSYTFTFAPLLHLMQFLNNYLLESKVKEKLNLDWYNEDHEVLFEQLGKDAPDFIDENGTTYELKQRKNFLDAARIRNWHHADKKLLYCTGDNTLYYYHSHLGKFEKICELRAPYVDFNRYRVVELRIRNKFNLHY